MILAAYNAAVTLLSPLAVLYLLFRFSETESGWKAVAERLGFSTSYLTQTRPGAIWLHAVSVGEVISAVELVRHLKKAFPWEPVFVSVTTPTGHSVAEERLTGLADGILFAPLDLPWSVRGVFNKIKPRLLIVLEAELWPNLFREAKRHGAGLMIVNGRLSDRSAPRYERYHWFFSKLLGFPDAILTQSPADWERFVAAGANPQITKIGGNLKYDVAGPSSDAPRALTEYLDQHPRKPLLVAGSTREGEERLVIGAFQQMRSQSPDARMILAPRHPDRCDEVAHELSSAGLEFAKRSELPVADSRPVILLDTLGELSSIFPLADLVFMGGSLNGWGGHNVLEAAVHGKPIVVGPHMQNFREITAKLLSAGGLVQTPADGLGRTFKSLCADSSRANDIGARALEAAEREQGATRTAAEEAVRIGLESTPTTLPAWGIEAALTPLTWLWTLGVRVKNRLGGTPKRLPRPAICVGNLTVGGTGKTPTVIWLSERLARRGLSSAVLTRGYGRKSTNSVTLAAGESGDRDQVGDEAALMSTKLSETPIGVSVDRISAAQGILKEHPVDCFVLDDGFQRLTLHRDFNLLLIDAARPLEFETTLPLGRLREPVSGIQRADAVILTRTRPDCEYSRLGRLIHRYNSRAPVYHSRMASGGIRYADSANAEPVGSLSDKRVLAFCGVANPGSFFEQLRSLNYDLIDTISFPDHHRYTESDWWTIASQAREANVEVLLTTEKDLVNLNAGVPPPQRTGAPPLAALEIELQVDNGEQLLDLIEERLRAALP